jgi:hypothetical protein
MRTMRVSRIALGGFCMGLAASVAPLPIAPRTPAAAPLDIVFARALGLEVDAVSSPTATERTEPRQLFADARPVEAGAMGEMRAGFAVNGVWVNLGFDMTTTMDGQPVQRMTLPMGGSAVSVASFSEGEAGTQTVLSEATLPLRMEMLARDGATRMMTDIRNGEVTQLLTNRADGLQLQMSAIFDVELVGMREMLVRQATNELVSNALAARRMFGR